MRRLDLGQATIRPKDSKKLEHMGIKVQFIGTIGEWNKYTVGMWDRGPSSSTSTLPFAGSVRANIVSLIRQKCSSIEVTTTNFYV